MFIKLYTWEHEWNINVDHIVAITYNRKHGSPEIYLTNGVHIEGGFDVDEGILKAAIGLISVDPAETGEIDTGDDDGATCIFEKEFEKLIRKEIRKKIDDGELQADPDLVESLRKLIVPKSTKGDK